MLGFNTLLRDEQVDPTEVKLVRHKDTRQKREQITPFELWRAGDGRFDRYQSIQRRDSFRNAKSLASFVVTPMGETLFVGMYSVRSVGTARAGERDPLTGKDVSGLFRYDLRKLNRLTEYRGRLFVDWGEGYRSWIQWAKRKKKENDKPVVEIRQQIQEDPFPGFLKFNCRLNALAEISSHWRLILGSVNGVYVLTCQNSGAQYVGAAYGEGGFWARWQEHARSGRGSTVGMKGIKNPDFKVGIVEVASSSASKNEITKIESLWKDKLLTRRFGLNRN